MVYVTLYFDLENYMLFFIVLYIIIRYVFSSKCVTVQKKTNLGHFYIIYGV